MHLIRVHNTTTSGKKNPEILRPCSHKIINVIIANTELGVGTDVDYTILGWLQPCHASMWMWIWNVYHFLLQSTLYNDLQQDLKCEIMTAWEKSGDYMAFSTSLCYGCYFSPESAD